AVESTPKPPVIQPTHTSVRLKRSHAQIAVAVVVVVSVVIAWMFRGGAEVPQKRTTIPQAAAPFDAPRPTPTDRPVASAPVPPVVANETSKPGAASAKPAVASAASAAAD